MTKTDINSVNAVSPAMKEFWGFNESLAGDIFKTQSILQAARSMLAELTDTDDGEGMHLDNVLCDVDEKLKAMVSKLNSSIHKYEAVKNS